MKSNSDSHKEEVYAYFDSHEVQIRHLMHVMTRESSIQLVYQVCILIDQYDDFPTLEFVFTDSFGLANESERAYS